ncbi:hypothetical protein BDF22DRAFT_745409 [Syncephalis plumigaleata]|nr:hypothetical protein BDF22DRAFT_745409 [Syncephalis plumigaleata]
MLIDAKQQLILPIELLEHILLYLDATSIVALATCARPLGVAVCQSERLWRHLYWKHYGSEEPLPGFLSSADTNSTALPTLSMVTNECDTHDNDSDNSGLARLPVARWLALLRLHAVVSSIWRRGIAYTLPVTLPQFDSSIMHTATEGTTQSTSKFPGELKLLDANKHGWSLVACTEPLAIMLLYNPPSSSTMTSTGQPGGSILQPTSSTQMHCLSLDPQLFNGAVSFGYNNNCTTLWPSVRYAPFHAIHGRLHANSHAVVTISAADAPGTAGRWCSAIWAWQITNRELCYYAESPDPYTITDLSSQALLYQQSRQPTSTNSTSNQYSAQYRQYGYADSIALAIAKGSAGCCHLHKLKASTVTLRQSMCLPIMDTVIYRHYYDSTRQQVNWQLVRPTTSDNDNDNDNDDTNKDTMELASNLKHWRLKSEGSLDCRSDNIYQTASTQVDNDRILLTGMTRDQHQRLTPFVLLHSLSVKEESTYKQGELWYCTGPRYAAQSTLVSPNLRYLLLQSMESMIRVISLENGQVLRSLPGLPNEGLPQPVTGDLWLVGATLHGELTLVDTDKNEQYLHQLEEIPSPIAHGHATIDEQETASANQSPNRLRPGLERQRWSVGLIGYDLLICVRAKAISIVRFRQAPPTIRLPSPAAARDKRKKSKSKLASQARRATISVFGSGNQHHRHHDHSSSPIQSNAASAEQQQQQQQPRPLRRKSTLLRTMARVIGTLQQSINQHTQSGT